MKVHFEKVKEIIISNIETDSISADESMQNMAIEIFTDEGKSMVFFEGARITVRRSDDKIHLQDST